MTKDYDYQFKLLIIGDSGVGKSCMLQRFAGESFSGTYVSTIGVDFKIRTVIIDEERVKLQVWDTAGQERFRTITSTYYRGTHGVIIVYDVTSVDSFNNVKRWLYEIDQNCDSVSCVLVGNKDDIVTKKVIQTAEAKRLADQLGIQLFETSARDGKNIDEMFMAITRLVLRMKKDQQARLQMQATDTLRLTAKSPRTKRKKKCC